MLRRIQRGVAMLGTVALLASPLASHAAVTSAFNVGDLIKGSGSAVYYFAPDGHRYTFPNDKTYFTWYPDFSTVKTISDGQLSTIPLGRNNVTYRPGRKMVKITTDPKTYVIDQGGVLRWVQTEQLAQTLYGISWKNQIDDIPDPFFINYRVGTPIQTASDYNPQNVMTQTTTITQDKNFDTTHVTVGIGSVNNGFVPTTLTVKAGSTVTWTNTDIVPHTVTGSAFDSGALDYNQSYSRVFSSVGSYDYHDTNHAVMQGTINVVP